MSTTDLGIGVGSWCAGGIVTRHSVGRRYLYPTRIGCRQAVWCNLKYLFVNSTVHPLAVNEFKPNNECCNSLSRQKKAWRRNRPMLSDPVPTAVRTAPCFAHFIVA